MASTERNQQGQDISRAKFLRLSGYGAAAIVGVAIEKSGVRERVLPYAPVPEDVGIDFISNLPMSIKRGVNIRTSPHFPSRSRIYSPDNTISWNEISAINGAGFGKSSGGFVISDAPIVKGDSASNFNPRNPENKWIKINVRLFGDPYYYPHYVSLSSQTEEYVKLISDKFKFPTPRKLSDGSFIDHNGNQLGYRLKGSVIVPSNFENAASESLPTLWSKKMTDKDRGKIPLRPKTSSDTGEIMASVVVNNSDKRSENVTYPGNTNVLSYPASEYLNGEKVSILGAITPGTRIKNAYIDSGFVSFRLDNLSIPIKPLVDSKILIPNGYQRFGALPVGQVAII